MLKLPPPLRARGFTLIEAVMVIVITGILAGMVAVFIKSPVDSYFDAARRAELTDVADVAVRRMARDIHLALPNSVRNPVDGSDQCVEFIPTKIGGRYRVAREGSGNGDILNFEIDTTLDAVGSAFPDGQFDMLWLNSALPASNRIVAGDVVVIYNDGSANGDAYMGINAIEVASLAEPGGTANTTAITFVDAGTGALFNRKQLPGPGSPASRFQVIPSGEHVVAYGCSAGTLYRYSRKLTGSWDRPADCAAMAAGATPATLAKNLKTCSLKYEPPGSSTNGLERSGIVSISLEISQSGESVGLYHQVHVDNVP